MKRFFILTVLLPLLFVGCGKKTNTETEMEVELQGISLNKRAVELEIGQTVNLIVVYNPEDAEKFATEVTWESSSPSVATVENGKVTAKQKGRTIISAYCGKYFADCMVEVITGGENVIDWNAPYIILSPNVINDNSHGGEYEVKVMSNQSWSATCGESWLSVSPSSGEGDATVKITVAERMTEAADQGSVTFTAGDIVKKVTVKRDERNLSAPYVSPAQKSVPVGGASFTVGVFHSSSEWEVSCSDKSVSFSEKTNSSVKITVGPSMGEADYESYKVISKEPSDKTIEVVFKNKENLSAKLTITQPNPFASAQIISRGTKWKDSSKAPTYVNEVVTKISETYGNKYDVKIHSNISWKIDFEYMKDDQYKKYVQNYMEAEPSSGNNDATILVTLKNVNAYYDRTGQGDMILRGTGIWEGYENTMCYTFYNQNIINGNYDY